MAYAVGRLIMEIEQGYKIEEIKDGYKTVVREFNETRGLWEDVVYKVENGIEYVSSRSVIEKPLSKSPGLSPTSIGSAPAKPKKVNKPVLDITTPKKPAPFQAEQGQRTVQYNVPGPLPEVQSAPVNRDTASQSERQYLYSYGLKNLSIEHSTFAEKGIFVSKPMVMEGNVIEVSLLSHEEHPLFDSLSGKAADRMTSVEYYIAYEENPSLSDWHPILPETEERVLSERMFFTGLTAKLRFHAKINEPKKTAVYKNGLRLDESKWCFIERGASIQLLEQRDLTAIYTVDYVPDPVFVNPWILNVKEKGAKRVRQIDVFDRGTAYNKTVTLSKYPYTDYEYIQSKPNYNSNTDSYRPFEVYLRNGAIAIGNGKNVDTVFPKVHAPDGQPFTLNRTDYKEGTDLKLQGYSIDPANKYAGFEYKHYRNKLTFSETFNRATINGNEKYAHGNAEIEVQYEYLVTNFRLKVILRKNTGNDIVVSPKVNDYQLKYKIMK